MKVFPLWNRWNIGFFSNLKTPKTSFNNLFPWINFFFWISRSPSPPLLLLLYSAFNCQICQNRNNKRNTSGKKKRISDSSFPLCNFFFSKRVILLGDQLPIERIKYVQNQNGVWRIESSGIERNQIYFFHSMALVNV